jgi:hypothetical protein
MQITVREFRKSLSKYLKEGCEVVSFGTLVATVTPSGLKTSVTKSTASTVVKTAKPKPIVVESKVDKFQELKKQFETPMSKQYGRCSKCGQRGDIESVVYEDVEGNDYQLSLCVRCMGRLKTQVANGGGSISVK